MPCMPAVTRPKGRASFSENLIACPREVTKITWSSPVDALTHLSESPFLSFMAIRPERLTEPKSTIGVFFTKPFLVAITKYFSVFFSFNCFSLYVRIACTFSSALRAKKLTIALPRDWREASGISHTLVWKTRPVLVKNSALSWVLVETKWVTASSSLVPIPVIPLPPRCWARTSVGFILLT